MTAKKHAHIAKPLHGLAVPIADLHPDPSNARRHGQRNQDAIKASLAAFGQRKPLVVQREGMIVRAGNGTLTAAKALGWEQIAAVVIDEDSAQAVQFAIADNRTAELAEWDDETLATLLDGMDEPTRDMLAFDDKELAGLMRGLEPDEIVEDKAPEPPADPITQPGDLIILGEHRLLCGDSTKREDVDRVMNGERAVMMLSDPPYNVGYSYSEHDDDMSDADYQAFVDAFMANGRAVSEMQCITPGKGNESLYRYEDSMIWYKGFSLTTGSFYRALITEMILLSGTKPTGCFYRTDHFDIRTDREPELLKKHTCPKPVKLFAELMEPMTEPGDVIFEAFGGSGTTLIAAEQLRRKCRAIEISPIYCDVIVERWENLTGQKAVRNG
jgi:ParB-like chromosome segregation protein Spo0J